MAILKPTIFVIFLLAAPLAQALNLAGDADLDGDVDLSDSARVLGGILGLYSPGEISPLACVDANNLTLELLDALLLGQTASGARGPLTATSGAITLTAPPDRFLINGAAPEPFTFFASSNSADAVRIDGLDVLISIAESGVSSYLSAVDSEFSPDIAGGFFNAVNATTPTQQLHLRGEVYIHESDGASSTEFLYKESIWTINRCGDGIHQYGEECDDGNLINGDGCSAVCEFEASPPTIEDYFFISEREKIAGLPISLPWAAVTVAGRTHTNDALGFRVDGAAFLDPVTQVCSGSCNSVDGAFLDGFFPGAPALTLPDRVAMQGIVGQSLVADGSNRMDRGDAGLWSDGQVREAQGGSRITSGFWGNTWIRFNDCNDHWWDAHPVQPDEAIRLELDLGNAANRSQVVQAYDLDDAGIGGYSLNVNYGGTSDFTGWMLEMGTGFNFLENALVGAMATVSWGVTSYKYAIVANDRNNIVIAANPAAPDLPADNVMTVQINCPRMLVWNAHYNRQTPIPSDGTWGTTESLSLAELVSGIAMAVNGGPGFAQTTRYGFNDLSGYNFDLVLGPTSFGSGSSVDSRLNSLSGIDNDEALEYISIGGDPLGQATTTEGQGPAAGVAWEAPVSGLIAALDPCNPYHPSRDAPGCPADIRSLANITSSTNWGEAASDVRVWGMTHGALTVATMRDIYPITNRSSLPLWHWDYDVLLAEHDYDDIEFSAITSSSSWQSISVLYGPGFLPINDGLNGLGNARCAYPSDSNCQGWNDQSLNLYGVIYEHNPDPADIGFMSCEGHRFAARCCGDQTYYLAGDGCTAMPTVWPDRDYTGGCAGDILGLFAYQNVFQNEDPSPRSDALSGGLIHQSAWQVNLEALMIAANHSALLTEHVYGGSYPQMGDFWSGVPEPGFEIDDRGNYARIGGARAYELGPSGNVTFYGSVVTGFRGISSYGTRGYLYEREYNACLAVTGPPPFTPSIGP